MKRLAYLLVIVLLPATALAKSPKPDADRMAQELGLTEEQREQIQQIREDGGGREEIRAVLTPEQQAKADAMHAKHAERRGERVERLKQELNLSEEQAQEMRDIFAAGGSREEIRAVLTEEQQTKFDEMRRHRGKGKGKGRPES